MIYSNDQNFSLLTKLLVQLRLVDVMVILTNMCLGDGGYRWLELRVMLWSIV